MGHYEPDDALVMTEEEHRNKYVPGKDTRRHPEWVRCESPIDDMFFRQFFVVLDCGHRTVYLHSDVGGVTLYRYELAGNRWDKAVIHNEEEP